MPLDKRAAYHAIAANLQRAAKDLDDLIRAYRCAQRRSGVIRKKAARRSERLKTWRRWWILQFL